MFHSCFKFFSAFLFMRLKHPLSPLLTGVITGHQINPSSDNVPIRIQSELLAAAKMN